MAPNPQLWLQIHHTSRLALGKLIESYVNAHKLPLTEGWDDENYCLLLVVC